jgi:hypothetical protein
MSYCHLVSSVRLEFSTREVELLRSRLEANSCLPGRLTITPNPPIPGGTVSVVYSPAGGPLAAAPVVNLGRGTNDWANGQSIEAVMVRNGDNWELTHEVPQDAFSVVYYLRNAGNVFDNNDSVDWRFATNQGFEPKPTPLFDRVSITPDPPIYGRQATITYRPGGTLLNTSTSVNIHRGVNGWDTVLESLPMTFQAQDGTWTVDWMIQPDATSIEFVFNEAATIWDNNSGDDWHFRTVPPPSDLPESWMIF